ncbi:class I SAM-dependent methyltransferase [Halobaculum sp. CBA1158]|uniref:methyltransferase domain-containing protein n=1 Tax=Halobaculum sp. CBA1158 TaxID=2904243 RepID=UPI001F1F6BF7|nr:class I SAM-dependent methyltransferase [Halobaculum sp. CBA1158]UIP00574.1 class I SAM-dependent methyltransferase [Halobaculum sp. CBA1158]
MPSDERTGLDTGSLLLVRAARLTGVLEALLSTAGTPGEVAAETDLSVADADRLVGALADLGLFEEVDGAYEPTNRALGMLAKRDVRSIGAIPHELDRLEELVGLPETLETGVPPERPAEWEVNALGAHHASDEATVRARVTAAVRAAPDADSVVDVCGGSGVHAREFAARGLDATLVESPSAVDALGRVHGDRVRLHAGTPAALEESFGLAFLGGVLSGMDPAEARATLAVTADLLSPGGALVAVDALGDGSAASVAAEARGLATGHGGAHDPDEVRDWLAEAGLADVRIESVPGTEDTAVIGVVDD